MKSVYLLIWKRETERKIPSIDSPPHPPKWLQRQGQAAARNSILVSQESGGGRNPWGIFRCFLRRIHRGLDQRQSTQDSNWHSNIGCQCHTRRLNPPHHNTGLSLKHLNWLIHIIGMLFSLLSLCGTDECIPGTIFGEKENIVLWSLCVCYFICIVSYNL